MRIERIGNCELYLGDCLEILPEIGRVDAVVTDPPYGINLNADFSSMKSRFKASKGGKKHNFIKGDDIPFDPGPLIAKANQFALLGGDYYMSRLPPGGSLSVWDKRLSESADKMFGSCFEMIWFFPARRRDIIRHKWAGFFGEKGEGEKKRVHPAQKPIGLMKKVILSLKNSPAVILDPFMGSGATGAACAELGRKFIGIEIDEKYFDIACKRITEAVNKTADGLWNNQEGV
jgi:site-specific DNA-methyltransferase (adenine-specific)/modification methylase